MRAQTIHFTVRELEDGYAHDWACRFCGTPATVQTESEKVWDVKWDEGNIVASWGYDTPLPQEITCARCCETWSLSERVGLSSGVYARMGRMDLLFSEDL